MLTLVVRRLLLALVTLFIISLIVFVGVEALPGAYGKSLVSMTPSMKGTLTGWGVS